MNQPLPPSIRRRTRRTFLPLLGIGGMLLLAPAVMADVESTPVAIDTAVNDEALVERSSRDFNELRVDPSLRMDDYEAVFILEPTITFRDRWQRDQNRYQKTKVTDRDVARIQADMSQLLKDVLGTKFEDAGFALAEGHGDGVLVVEPAIVELNIIAPDTPNTSRSFTYSDSAGSMTLVLSLKDGASGKTVLTLSDRKRDPQRGFLEWRTRPYNTSIARNMMRGWADDLIETLQDSPERAVTR